MEMFEAILRVVLIFLIIFVERKKPAEALLWIALVFVAPIIGGVIYLIFGSTLRIKLAYQLRSRPLYKPYLQVLSSQLTQFENETFPLPLNEEERALLRFNLTYSEGGISIRNKVKIITTGQEKYDLLFEDIAQAEHHIHVAYYSIHKDRIGKQLAKLLTEKAKEGVEVKVICDGIGSMGSRLFLFQPLIRAGGEVKMIKPLFSHFRYHRKIVVIDGRIGYTGGMNIGTKYLGEHPKKHPWRDTQLRMRGESVRMLQYFFLYDWLFANWGDVSPKYLEEAESLFPPVDHVYELMPCQIIGGGVDTDKQAIKLSYLRMVSLARKKIVIQTPYFIPSSSFLEELKVALSSGVEVTLHLPARNAGFFLDPVTRYFVSQLLPLGLRVFRYEGYVHSKAIRVDDAITAIGSVNIDVRSFEVDDEIYALFYGKEMAKRYDSILEDDFSHSHEIDYEAFENRSLLAKASERFFLLFSPLM